MTEYGSLRETKNGWKTVISRCSDTPSPAMSESAYADATHDVMVSGTVTFKVCSSWSGLDNENKNHSLNGADFFPFHQKMVTLPGRVYSNPVV